MSVPDPLGRDRLAAGAASYRPPVHGVKPPRPPFYLQWRFIALGVAVLLLISFMLYRSMSTAEDSPKAAASRVIELFLDQKYSQMRTKLCRADRAQVGANDLETAGRSGGDLLKTLDKPQVESVTDVALQGSYAGVQAKQVAGLITPIVGAGTTFHVVTVNEDGGWRVCLSAGGYGLGAFNLDVPIGGDLASIG
ncbi:MAG: hypothetical protein JWN31_2000 [Frankiales bacterium]|nr:hypothetical protein [Frankiales bacterium]